MIGFGYAGPLKWISSEGYLSPIIVLQYGLNFRLGSVTGCRDVITGCKQLFHICLTHGSLICVYFTYFVNIDCPSFIPCVQGWRSRVGHEGGPR